MYKEVSKVSLEVVTSEIETIRENKRERGKVIVSVRLCVRMRGKVRMRVRAEACSLKIF